MRLVHLWTFYLAIALATAGCTKGSNADVVGGDTSGTDVAADVVSDVTTDVTVDGDAQNDGVDAADTTDATDTVIPPDWPSDVILIHLDDTGHALETHTFEVASTMTSLDWAQLPEVGCWDDNLVAEFYSKNHVSFALADLVGPWYDVTITVTASGNTVETNPYVIQTGPTQRSVPPAITSAEFCYKPVQLPGPGVANTVSFRTYDGDHNIFFGVANRNRWRDDDTGSFTVEVQVTPVDPASQCYAHLDKPGKWAPHVNKVALDSAGSTAFVDTLEGGAPVCSLAFAADSNVACFPATQFEHFNGAQKFYALEETVPAQTYVTITVTPDPGVDVNLYGAWEGSTNYYIPPNFLVGGCEASLTPSAPNPGEPESYSIWTGNNPYNFFFAVAGPNTLAPADGTFTVAIDTVSTSTSTCTDADYSAVSGLDAWPSQVTKITLDGSGVGTASGNVATGGAPLCTLNWAASSVTQVGLDSAGNGSVSGDLSAGSCLNLAWAANSAVACFPATQFDRFTGNHVFYALSDPIPPNSELTITATPNGNGEISLYGLQIGTTNHPVPPAVYGAICEASFNYGSPNPGAAETIKFYNPSDTNSYNIFFAVAGDGVTGDAGAYTVDIELLTSKPHCPESLPGQSGLTSWPSNVSVLSLDGNNEYTGSGDLSTGACVNLGFADDSAVACFPETQFGHYGGNHNYYALQQQMPANSIVTITADPKPGVDVNLYGFQLGATNFMVPPAVPSAICEASNPFTAPNPDEPESITFYNPTGNSYNIFFAVAGNINTGTAGQYDLHVAMEVGQTHCPESLPGQTYTSWPSSVKRVALTGPSTILTGDLSSGRCTNLAFASDSSMACFPATLNTNYQGNHVFYALDSPLPPTTNLTITATATGGTPISLYGYTIGTNSYYTPPFVPGAVACEYAIPGGPSSITLNTIANPYNVFFAVAGDTGATSGGYQIAITVN